MNQDYNNYNQQPQQPYQQPQQTYYVPQQPAPKTTNNSNGVGLASFICGLACFICNPLYLVCLAAIILGIVGLCQAGKPKGFAIAGLILGIVGTGAQLIFDILTMGIGFFL